jgi:hypothetical protein
MSQCIVKTYDWAGHLEKDFKKAVGTKKYHHIQQIRPTNCPLQGT